MRQKLQPRFTISNVNFNPDIPSGTFDYKPQVSDSTAPTSQQPVTPRPVNASVVGSSLPDLEARDLDYRPVKLNSLKGQPLLITFWAPWCAPCRDEFKALQTLRGPRIVAIAVQDSRPNVLDFVKNNPQFEFTILTDPEMPAEESRLSSFFGI
jgi:thiol-disulfide isomerase/thioredoxin